MLPTVFLLPPELIALMPIAMHLPEWLKVRYPWFMQSFNIANHTVDIFAAWAVAHLILEYAPGPEERVWLAAGLAATLVYVVLNHTIVAVMLRLARGMHWRETGLLSFQSLSNEMVVGLLGFALVSFWKIESVADPDRDRADAADPPLARRAGARGGGARRPEDRALQRPPLRRRA